jgi:hypothetical protein
MFYENDTILELLNSLKFYGRVLVRKVASIVGELISMSVVLGTRYRS